jgi:diguanylate cyclase (GGDEF)-like protein
MKDDKNTILVVDDEKANIMTLTHILSDDYTIYAANNGKYAIELAKKHLPDIILLDIIMPDLDGYEVLSILKDTYETKNIPVIFITGLSSSEDEERGLSLGAEDYISKPFSPAIVKLRVRKLIQLQNQIAIIKQLSMVDQQNSVLNKNELTDRLKLMWEHAKKNKTSVSMLQVYINNFNYFTDNFGEQQGDLALQVVAKVIEQSFNRSIDVVARLSGPLYGVLLLGYNKQSALDIAENIRLNVEKTLQSYSGGRVRNIVVCIGLNFYSHAETQQEVTVEEFVIKAEQALMNAKIRGKIVICENNSIIRAD